MKLKLFAALAAITTLTTVTPVGVLAAPKTPKPFELPANATQISENLYSLGTATDPHTGKTVQGYAYIHRKNSNAKPAGAGGKPGSCYSFLADGAKWKGTPEAWLMNPTNTRGLDESLSFGVLAGGVSRWETAASADIFGAGTQTATTLSAETTAPDNQNEAYFGPIAEANVIAVTTTWGIFSGPVKNRVLVEWDMVFDQESFDWSLTGEAAKMDLDNIATHELGHAMGLGHPASSCTEETMYAYAGEGETKKRDLGTGDVAGINALY